jgi:hypothetical protein
MNILYVLKKDRIERDNIKYLLLGVYLKKSEKWLNKHNDENDFFDRYLGLFIAVNIAYELWRKIVNKYPSYEDKRDFKNSGDNLISSDIKSNLINDFSVKLFALLEREDLYIKIGSKENKKDVQKVFSDSDNEDEKFKAIWESFYSVRCNLVHGEKGYEDRQGRLLALIYPQLKFCLDDIIKKLKTLNHLLAIYHFIRKDVVIDSQMGKKYRILDINDEKIIILRKNAKDKERNYIILIKDIYSILYKFCDKYSEIDTISIKEYVDGVQSPVIAILKYSNIIK